MNLNKNKQDLIKSSRSISGILSAYGLWYFNSNWFLIYRFYGFLLHFSGSFILTAFMWINFLNTKTVDKLADSLFMTLTETAMLFKIYNLIVRGSKLTQLFSEFENENFQPKTDEEMEYFIKAHRDFKRIKYFYIGVAHSCICAGYLGPFFDIDYKLPFPIWLPFDWKKTDTYWYAYCYEIFSMTLTCGTNATLDMLHTYVIFQIQYYFEIIGLRFSKLGYEQSAAKSSRNNENQMIKKLIYNIKTHQLITKLAKDVEDFVALPIFIQNSMSALVICVTAYQLQSTSPIQQTGEFLMLLYFLITMASQIFFPCYYGHLLTIKSDSLTNCLFHSNWYNCSLKYKKLTFIFMELLKTPVIIKAKGFFIIGLGTFTGTMRSAYSMFAVLLNVNQK